MLEEPVLMQNQNGALNEDTFAQQEFLKLKEKFQLKNAVETGTCLGYTTAFLASHYEKVHTVEIMDKYYDIAYENRLKGFDNCVMHKGSSAEKLFDMLDQMGDDTFIFLDAHWGNHCPLKDELKAIARRGIKPVIAIHDFFVPNHPELGYDSINGQAFNYEWLKPEFDAIYGEGNYEYYFNSESVGAKRGIIYLHLIEKNN